MEISNIQKIFNDDKKVYDYIKSINSQTVELENTKELEQKIILNEILNELYDNQYIYDDEDERYIEYIIYVYTLYKEGRQY